MLKKRKRPKIVFEVVPLIDVMMVLTIFFAIAAFLPQVQNSIGAKLPRASSSEKAEEALIVSVNSFGNIYIKEELVSKNELRAKLNNILQNDRNLPILLAADNSLKYDDVVSILDIIKSSGAVQIGLLTED